MTNCTDTVRQLRDKLEEQDAFLQSLVDAPKQCGVIISIEHDRARVAIGGTISDVALAPTLKKKAKIGSTAFLAAEAGLIDVKPPITQPGPAAFVKAILGPSTLEVSLHNDAFVVVTAMADLKEGDRVQLDAARTVALQKLPAPPAPVDMPTVERVEWSDIGGLAAAKRAIEEAVLWPHQHKALLKAYGQRESKGLLFYGPPGCGKTMLAKAVATALANHGTPGFFAVRGPELLNPYVGETALQIRQLFAQARAHQATHGTRAVVFIDEADAVLSQRGTALHHDISVPAFLVEMDGIDAAQPPLVILATNRAADLDEAIVREGRVDRRIKIERPEAKDVEQLFTLYLAKRPLKDPLSTVAIMATTALVGSTLWPQRSGAQVAALVDRATNAALRRDLEQKKSKPSGITLDDCITAITEAAATHTLA